MRPNAPTFPATFDPLAELYGLWTLELADRYLPVPGMPPVRHECVDGQLIMSLRSNSGTSWAAGQLSARVRDPARAAGHCPYLRFTIAFDPQSWIEPDLVVLHGPAVDVDWAPAANVLMPIELVCPPSVRSDRIDRRAMCAAAGVPYFMRVEIGDHDAEVELLRLNDAGEYVVQARAMSGQEFRTDLPFPLSFDPVELLEP